MQNSAKSRKKAQGSDQPLPRGTVTFLFTDIEGSTRLLARLRDGYAEVLGEHHRALRAAFAEHRGHEVHTEGDAFVVAFARATDAVAAAVSAQRMLAAHDWPQGVDLRVRMGVNTGTADVWGDDYVGLDVHRTARICSAAHGGQVLVSSATRELVAGELASDVELRDLGEHRLKDLERPERLFQIVAGGLPADFPPARSEAPADRAAARLPPAPNRTIGREADVEAIARRIGADGVRLLTLTGPGGVGKTRLAVEAARAMQADFADGARFVSLAALERHEDVAQAIVSELGIIVLSGETPEQAATRFLAAKEIVLVVDNLEHMLGAAPFIGDLLDACPTLTALATSREPLVLRAEARYPVDGLAATDAEALFAERARLHEPGFRADGDNAPHVAEICQRLDHLPLAIELAAARCTLLSPAEIADRLDAVLGAPGAGPRDAPERQRTLRATIDWSHDLLDGDEKACFARFAVLSGGATVEAAEAITGAELDTLDRLVAKSLFARRAGPDGATRLLMLEMVRAYAGERFAALPDAEAVRAGHHAYYLALAQRHGADRALWSADGRAHAAVLDAEADNLTAALTWAVGAGDAARALALVAALGRYWLIRDRNADAVAWVDWALALPGASAHEVHCARALRTKAMALWALGRGAEQDAVLADSEAAARRAGDPVVVSEVLQMLSSHALGSEQLEVAAGYADEALEHAIEAADEWTIALASMWRALTSTTVAELRERTAEAAKLLAEAGNAYNVAELLISGSYAAMCLGSYEDATTLVARALPITRELGSPRQWMMLDGNHGLAALVTGDVHTARAAFREELALCRELVVMPLAYEGLSGLAAIATVDGDDDRAARLLGAAEAFRYDNPGDPVRVRLRDTFFEPARARHGLEAWDAAARQGSALSFADAVAYGLEERSA
jgi:predicted ATPase/class 3 adenylate cyclase